MTEDSRSRYRFELGDKVVMCSIDPIYPIGTIICKYTSDEFNHTASPHKRYMFYVERYCKGIEPFQYKTPLSGAELCYDVSEEELLSYDEWLENMENMK